MLIRDAELDGHRRDLRIRHGRISAIETRLAAAPDETVIDAQGGALLAGLHDHHLHLRALAAARASVACGPPAVTTAEQLIAALAHASAGLPPEEWLRGIGYHPRVAGEIDRHWLDRHGPARPIRIQHRSGRCWLFNTRALTALCVDPDRTEHLPFERIGDQLGGQLSGRLFDADDWLRARLPRRTISLAAVSAQLACHGVTALTDATPRNDTAEFEAMGEAMATGELLQRLTLMGDASLDAVAARAPRAGMRLGRGATKFHLHDADLPAFDTVVAAIRRSHQAQRGVAFHCVTRGELAFAVAAIGEAGAIRGDRIEHASVTPPQLLDEIVRLGLRVVAQPNFVGERGDAYLDEVDADDQPWLYRLRSFIDRGVALSGSTDAPFGDADPWAAMRAAVQRRTPDGRVLSLGEALTPELALGLFSPHAAVAIRPGAPADLCLLDRPWAAARTRLQAADVQLTLAAGRVIAARGSSERGRPPPAVFARLVDTTAIGTSHASQCCHHQAEVAGSAP